MSFMKLFSDRFVAFIVETTEGTCVVPADLVGGATTPLGEEHDSPDMCDALADYCEGEPLSYKAVQGWFARYSAPGYLDCTDWMGPYETEDEAIAECKELYGDESETEIV